MKNALLVFAVVVACDGSDPSISPAGNDGGASSSSSGSSGTSSSSGSSSTSSSSGGVDGGTSSGATFNDKPACAKVTVTDDLTSAPLAAPPSVNGVSFVTDWAAKPESGGWKRSQRMDLCRYHGDGKTWHDKAAARIEVMPGDDPLALGAGSERAEMLGAQAANGDDLDETKTSGVVFYAFSYRFPATWDGTFLKGDENSWSFVMQLYGWGGLAAGRRGDGQPQSWFVTSPKGDLAFTGGGATIALGKWTDFVARVDWATGHFTLWRRTEGETAFTKEIDADGGAPDGSIYLKQGLYRGGDVKGRTDILWVGPLARGTSFAGVESAAFATSVGQP